MDRIEKTLRAYLDSRDVSREYERHLGRAASKLRDEGVTLRESSPRLLASKINRVLRSFTHCTTRANYRRVIVTLLRQRYGERYKSIASLLMPVKPLYQPPVAYTSEEVVRLLRAAESMEGEFLTSRCSRADWLAAFILCCYETGLRFQDVLDMRASAVRGNRLSVVVHKTQRFLHKLLSDDLADRLYRLSAAGDGRTVFRWACSKKHACVWLRRVWHAAKLPGSCRWLRRTGATMVEAKQVGAASVFLGHSPNSQGLAARHYIDQSLLPDRCPTPPTISLSPREGRDSRPATHRKVGGAFR